MRVSDPLGVRYGMASRSFNLAGVVYKSQVQENYGNGVLERKLLKIAGTSHRIEHYIISYTVHPEVSKDERARSLGLRYLSPNGRGVANYVMLNKEASIP